MTESTPSRAALMARRDIVQGYPDRALGALHRYQVGNDYATADTMFSGVEPGADALYYSCDVLLGTFDTEDADVLVTLPELRNEVRDLVETSIAAMKERRDKYVATGGLLRAIRRKQADTLDAQITRGQTFLEDSAHDD